MTSELDDTGRELVGRLVALNAQIAELAEAAEAVKDRLRGHLDVGSYTINGRSALSLSWTRRFSPALATTVLPPELLALCQVTAVDAKRARAVLPPGLYDSCQEVAGKPQVRLA